MYRNIAYRFLSNSFKKNSSHKCSLSRSSFSSACSPVQNHINQIVEKNKSIHVAKVLCSNSSKKLYSVVLKTTSGEIKLSGKEGDSILDLVNDGGHDIDGFGACDGTIACSTCHCVLTQTDFDAQEENLTAEEQDLLDMIEDVRDTSRLGCQLFMGPELDGAVVEVPDIRDLREA